jgi:mannose-6-phosphate isomerase-like protein (cupin superfamily)
MGYTITRDHFTTEKEALAEIEGIGWHSIARDIARAENEEWHWHDFDAVAFVVSGTARVEYEDGVVVEAGAGCCGRQTAGTMHRELGGSSYRVVFGFPVKPSEFTQPLNKPAATLDAFRRAGAV